MLAFVQHIRRITPRGKARVIPRHVHALTIPAVYDVFCAACRTKFAHLRYLRKNGTEDDVEENVVVYLVDAHELAVPDQDGKEVLAKAASAATTDIEAKKVGHLAALSKVILPRRIRPPLGLAVVSISSCSNRVLLLENPGLLTCSAYVSFPFQTLLPAGAETCLQHYWSHKFTSLLQITWSFHKPLRMQALDAAEEEEKSAEANFQLLGSQDIPPPPDMGDDLTINPGEMTVAALQEALSKRGLDTKWNPLKSKKELVDRLQVKSPPFHVWQLCWWLSYQPQQAQAVEPRLLVVFSLGGELYRSIITRSVRWTLLRYRCGLMDDLAGQALPL